MYDLFLDDKFTKAIDLYYKYLESSNPSKIEKPSKGLLEEINRKTLLALHKRESECRPITEIKSVKRSILNYLSNQEPPTQKSSNIKRNTKKKRSSIRKRRLNRKSNLFRTTMRRSLRKSFRNVNSKNKHVRSKRKEIVGM